MKSLSAFFIVLLFASCSSSKKITEPKIWTYDEAKKTFDSLNSRYPDLYEHADWLNVNMKCDEINSSFSFPEKGLEDIQKKVVYPAEARKSGVQGEVIVQYTVLKNGTVTDIKTLLSPSTQLSLIVRNILESTPFVNAFCNGEPADSRNIFKIHFRLHDQY